MAGKAEYGFSSMAGNIFSGANQLIGNVSQGLQFHVLRTKKVILSPEDEYFNKAGGWISIGAILFEDVNSPSANDNIINIAYPYLSNIKQYPLKGELVLAITLPDSNPWVTSNNSPLMYYLPPINIWKNTNTNSSPFLPSKKFYKKFSKSIQETKAGSPNKTNNQEEGFSLGDIFKKTSGVNPLQYQEGDLLIEGRFGNSIRLGSEEGEEPNILIRTGQGVKKDPLVTIDESIQNDSSSIYLTTKQKVSLEANTFSYGSYDEAPEQIDKFTDPQVIINSNRLVFNSNNDHTLISSATSINLNSQGTVNIDSKDKFVVNCVNLKAKKDSQNLHTIYLGGKDAKEPIALGGRTTEVLVSVLDQLILVLGTLELLVGFPAGVPNIPVNAAAAAAKQTLTTQVTKLRNEYIKSPVCKTL